MEAKQDVPQFIQDGVDHLLDRTKKQLLKGFEGKEVEEQLQRLALVVRASEEFRTRLLQIKANIGLGELAETSAPPAQVEEVKPAVEAPAKKEVASKKELNREQLALKVIRTPNVSGAALKEVITFLARSKNLTIQELAAKIPVSVSYLYGLFSKKHPAKTSCGRNLIKWARKELIAINQSK